MARNGLQVDEFVEDAPARAPRAPKSPLDHQLLTILYQALADRALVWAAGLGGAGAFAWALWHPGPWTLGAAVAFTAMIYLPTLKWKG